MNITTTALLAVTAALAAGTAIEFQAPDSEAAPELLTIYSVEAPAAWIQPDAESFAPAPFAVMIDGDEWDPDNPWEHAKFHVRNDSYEFTGTHRTGAPSPSAYEEDGSSPPRFWTHRKTGSIMSKFVTVQPYP